VLTHRLSMDLRKASQTPSPVITVVIVPDHQGEDTR